MIKEPWGGLEENFKELDSKFIGLVFFIYFFGYFPAIIVIRYSW